MENKTPIKINRNADNEEVMYTPVNASSAT